ncbi:uncharacterized protein I303_108054 [Kwoniella dejecticola CBS 10117]|uniref:Alpha 1,6-mannosyltransferase n=1 Tax=Kwoniella dejecticola CBS 10117 TaxID=1296121 RepID=A0A1A5ZWE7_9TREE|nr:uncharacterized protein I303_08045 [Kwoniella dejecticola CBS 10117]OBR82131.1 hypothetical protein I303_08045 [Kwoniella dejecticola CBS 10117]
MSSSSASSSSTSRRSSSDHSASAFSNSSTVFSPTISNSQTFKSNHSRNSSRTSGFGGFAKAFIHDNKHEDLEENEKNLDDDPLLPQYQLPRSPSLDQVSSFTHLPTKLPLSLPHPHIGLRRRRLLSQVLGVLGILTFVGWWMGENGYMRNVFNDGGGISSEYVQDPKLPGVIIGFNGHDLLEETKAELSHAEKMASLAQIRPQEWGLGLSTEHFLAGLRQFPENPPITTALSVLGTFADNIYLLGPLEKRDYFYQMREFANEVFPKGIAEGLVGGLIGYIGHPDQPDFDAAYAYAEQPGGAGGGRQSWDSTKHIWQTDKDTKKKGSQEVGSWKDGKAFDEGWEWDLLTDSDADKYVNRRLAGSRFKEIWDNLPSGILRSDTLRYLLVLLEGGIYTDTDTTLLKSPSEWGNNPKLFKGGQGWLTEDQLERISNGENIDDIIGRPSVIVGLEADVGDREDWFDWWPRPLQIVQWTITSAPNHPIALNALLRIYHSTVKAIEWSHSVAHSVNVLKDQGRYEDAKKLAEVGVLNEPKNGGPVGVMAWTGPGVWTDAVLSYLRVKYGLVWTDLKNLRVPMRIGDVVVLPVTGFSPGVGNFGAQMNTHPQAMVEHKFAGSWKEKEN